MVGALEATGAIDEVAEAVKDMTGGDRTAELLGILWVGGDRLGDRRQHPVHDRDDPRRRGAQRPAAADDAYWWALSLGACFGGNATMIAAAANVAAAGLTERAGQPIGFVAFLQDRHSGDHRLAGDRERLRRRPLRSV